MEEVASPQAIVIRDEIQRLRRENRALSTRITELRRSDEANRAVMEKLEAEHKEEVAALRAAVARERHGNELLRNGLVRMMSTGKLARAHIEKEKAHARDVSSKLEAELRGRESAEREAERMKALLLAAQASLEENAGSVRKAQEAAENATLDAQRATAAFTKLQEESKIIKEELSASRARIKDLEEARVEDRKVTTEILEREEKLVDTLTTAQRKNDEMQKQNQLLISRTDQLQSALHEVEVSATAQAEDHARQVDAISSERTELRHQLMEAKKELGEIRPLYTRSKEELEKQSLQAHAALAQSSDVIAWLLQLGEKKDADSGAYLDELRRLYSEKITTTSS